RDADRTGIEPLGREPQRQERQLHAERDEQRGVEDREPPRKRRMEERQTAEQQLQCVLRRRPAAIGRSLVLEAPQRHIIGVLPSPLWGGVGGGGRAIPSVVALL